MEPFLHCLVPEEVFHMLQEFIKSKVAAVRSKIIRIHTREVKDIAN